MLLKTRLTFIFFFISLCVLAASQPSPSVVVNEFYKYHFAHDMGFSEETFKAREKWFTPDAIADSKKYFAFPGNPDEPPYIEGDAFTGSQEYPNLYSLGAETISGTTAQVPVTFTWKEDGHTTKGIVILKNIDGKWLMDDVTFADQDSFRKLLQDAVKQ